MSDYPFKLDEWQEEKVDIATIDPVMRNGRVVGVEKGTRQVTQKVRYTRLSEPSMMSCADLQHEWIVKDKHIHKANCRNCKQVRFIRAIFEKVFDGKIVDRDTGEQLF